MSSARAEDKSGFYPILESLIKNVPGARAAIFCDEEGEAIEFCGEMDAYDIKIAGAYAAVLLPGFQTQHNPYPKTVIISCRSATLYMRSVENYILTLILERRTFSAGLEEAVEKAVKKFKKEAGI